MHRSKMVFLAAVFAALWTPGASAEILSVSSSGAGGTTPLLAVVSYNSPNDGVEYNADFTSAAPISINFTVSPTASPATYLFGLPGGFTVTNDSGVGFSAFDVRLSTILNLSGATLASASADPDDIPRPDLYLGDGGIFQRGAGAFAGPEPVLRRHFHLARVWRRLPNRRSHPDPGRGGPGILDLGDDARGVRGPRLGGLSPGEAQPALTSTPQTREESP